MNAEEFAFRIFFLKPPVGYDPGEVKVFASKIVFINIPLAFLSKRQNNKA